MSGRYGDLIKEARKQETKKTREKEAKTSEPDVNLSIKVPLSLRRHWSAEAKRQGVTLTSVIIAALREEFGEP
jgi:hypothetical protein